MKIIIRHGALWASLLSLVLIFILSTTRANADPAPLSPPELVRLEAGIRPDDAREEVRIRFLITLDEHGKIEGLEILEGHSPDYDARAQEALERSEFRPARRGDEPIASRFEFLFVFPEIETEAEALDARDETARSESSQDEEAERDAGPESRRADGRENGNFESDARSGNEDAELSSSSAESHDGEDGAHASDEDAFDEEEDDAHVPRFGARGRRDGLKEQRERSVEAVDVVDVRAAHQRTADLGEVITRTEAVTVRREGGLGSPERIGLGGFEGQQVRLFLDGVPLGYTGFAYGLSNIPIAMIERADIYRGVVPIRYGTDAIGGAIDLVSPPIASEPRLNLSYQTGSFGTHRLSAGGSYRHEKTGFITRANVFFDHADNDYKVEADVWDSSGRSITRDVALFNAGYRAYGALVDVGVIDKPYAKLFLLRGYTTYHHRGIGHNATMSLPVGEADYAQRGHGATLRYENDFLNEQLSLSIVGGYNNHNVRFVDLANCFYDWFGNCQDERILRGEIFNGGSDLTIQEHRGYARVNVGYRLNDKHAFTLSLAPTTRARDAHNAVASTNTALSGTSSMTNFIGGIDYTFTLADRFENSVFGKLYTLFVAADEWSPAGESRRLERQMVTGGFGDSLRFDLHEAVYLKASYEWATRLPGGFEIFGDGALIAPNLYLRPERSHNGNLSLTGRIERERFGSLRGEIAFFARRIDDVIWQSLGRFDFTFQNVATGRALGATLSLNYRTKREIFGLRGNTTYQDYRSISKGGGFERTYGDRMPNRPYFTANLEGELSARNFIAGGDRLSLISGFRYVHEYFLAFESFGASTGKLMVPSQFVLNAAINYSVPRNGRVLSATIEAQNLNDANVYDFFGIQRPGRAIYAKFTLDI